MEKVKLAAALGVNCLDRTPSWPKELAGVRQQEWRHVVDTLLDGGMRPVRHAMSMLLRTIDNEYYAEAIGELERVMPLLGEVMDHIHLSTSAPRNAATKLVESRPPNYGAYPLGLRLRVASSHGLLDRRAPAFSPPVWRAGVCPDAPPKLARALRAVPVDGPLRHGAPDRAHLRTG